ncbi:hypothetical protein ACOYZY_13925 [Salibacterium aidingense]
MELEKVTKLHPFLCRSCWLQTNASLLWSKRRTFSFSKDISVWSAGALPSELENTTRELLFYKGLHVWLGDYMHLILDIGVPQYQLENISSTSFHTNGIKSRLILCFPHPNFFLHHATPDLPIIFASQIKRYLSKWQPRNRPLSKTQRQLAERLKTLVIESSPYTLLPSYTFEQLQKGIFCPTCSSLLQLQDKTLMCQKCSYQEPFKQGVLRNVIEFKVLFPNEAVTTNKIYEWCGSKGNKKRTSRIL